MAPSADSGKKRKRQADGAAKPSKRVALEDRQDVKIRLQEGDKWAPVIATTPGLDFPKSISLKSYARPRPNASKNARGEVASKEVLLRSADDAKLQYTAREEDDDGEGDATAEGVEPFLKHYVGVYDPETGKLDVLEARSMTVRATVVAHQPQAESEGVHMWEQRIALGEAFGTKKAKKAILSRTENAISPDKSARNKLADGTTKVDSASAAMMADMAEATAGMATKEELDLVMNANKPRPQANTETTELSKVYTIAGLIGTETMAAIQVRPWEVEMKAGKEVMVPSRFVASRLNKFKGNVEKLKLLRYMLLLIEFYNSTTSGRDGRKVARGDDLKKIIEGQPESLLNGLKRKFTEGPLMTRHSADLLITHLCAMAMIVDNYEVEMWDLKDDLKLEIAPMAQYFKEIGARVVALPEGMRKILGIEKAAAAQRKVARLKIPLEFPTTKFVRGSKR